MAQRGKVGTLGDRQRADFPGVAGVGNAQAGVESGH